RRVLSALLGVNPNTVQKAYRVLEEEALIESHTGARSYMVLDARTTRRIRAELLESDVLALIQAMRQMGVEKQDALALVETLWEQGGAE
ncbi:MAG: GntR family transcriptional regulator, partial [Clostridiales bacterium]|nr:GntR family transcriptional regulator [Clostridiales bacterium]